MNSIDKGQNWNNNDKKNNNVKGKSYSWNKKKNVVNDGTVDTPKPKEPNVINLTNDIQTTKQYASPRILTQTNLMTLVEVNHHGFPNLSTLVHL